jgi:hypothetical protein
MRRLSTLQFYVCPRQLQLGFERADDDVGARDLGREADPRVIIVGESGIQPGRVRLDTTRESAPEIDFPDRVKPA